MLDAISYCTERCYIYLLNQWKCNVMTQYVTVEIPISAISQQFAETEVLK